MTLDLEEVNMSRRLSEVEDRSMRCYILLLEDIAGCWTS